MVARGRVILFHRLENRAIVDALDALTGKRIWSAEYPTLYRDDFGFDEGPVARQPLQATEFTLLAPKGTASPGFATGKRVWSVDFKQKFGSEKGFSARLAHRW